MDSIATCSSLAKAVAMDKSYSARAVKRADDDLGQLTDVFNALQAYLGSYYVNDFNRFGRTWQVNVQADAAFRVDAETVKQLKVRNADGDMVPLGAVADVRDSAGPVQITRYNMFPTASINGQLRSNRL